MIDGPTVVLVPEFTAIVLIILVLVRVLVLVLVTALALVVALAVSRQGPTALTAQGCCQCVYFAHKPCRSQSELGSYSIQARNLDGSNCS